MRLLYIKISVVLFGIQSLNAQINTNAVIYNCANQLATDYILKMGIADTNTIKTMPIVFSEVLKKSELEEELNGVFIVSNLNAHRRKLILLKKENQIRILTFSDINKSILDLISFLNDIKINDEDLFKYIDFIHQYIESSKTKITVINELDNSDWINCDR